MPQLGLERATILATDLNDAFLDFARAGIYRRWSFRRTDPADLDAYFRPLGDGRYEIDPQVRDSIRFASLNLAAGTYPSLATGTAAQDVIFCRNVLMYFGHEQARRVIARLRDCLVDGGWLVVNASEASTRLFEVCGTRAALDSLNLHRHWRNARTHTLHDPAAWKVRHLGRWALDGQLPPNHGHL